jgi:hypothetical protein
MIQAKVFLFVSCGFSFLYIPAVETGKRFILMFILNSSCPDVLIVMVLILTRWAEISI